MRTHAKAARRSWRSGRPGLRAPGAAVSAAPPRPRCHRSVRPRLCVWQRCPTCCGTTSDALRPAVSREAPPSAGPPARPGTSVHSRVVPWPVVCTLAGMSRWRPCFTHPSPASAPVSGGLRSSSAALIARTWAEMRLEIGRWVEVARGLPLVDQVVGIGGGEARRYADARPRASIERRRRYVLCAVRGPAARPGCRHSWRRKKMEASRAARRLLYRVARGSRRRCGSARR